MSNRELLERCKIFIRDVKEPHYTFEQINKFNRDKVELVSDIKVELSKSSLISKDQIRETLLNNGFTVKEGQDDLKPYVYEAVYALLDIISKPSRSEDEWTAFNLQRELCEERLKENGELKSEVESIRSDRDGLYKEWQDTFGPISFGELKSKLVEAEKDAKLLDYLEFHGEIRISGYHMNESYNSSDEGLRSYVDRFMSSHPKVSVEEIREIFNNTKELG